MAMDKIDNGGPAFPCEGGEASGLHPDPGMTLRDYFAAAAMQGMYAGLGAAARVGPKHFAADAAAFYQVADAMLAERAKRGQ